jgi:hypothetical protein
VIATPRELEQVRALIRLATDAGTPEAEAAAAALQACKRIARHDLLSLEAARELRDQKAEAEEDLRAERARGEGARGPSGLFVRIEVLLVVMSESPVAYRFARLRSDFRTAGMPMIGWIRKRMIHQTIWASPEIARTYSSAGRRVVEALIVPQEIASAVREIVTGAAR